MTSVSNGLKCPACGSRDIEFHESAGHAACVECGTLLEENTIVSSIEFQETGDRSHVIGQFVSANNANKPFNNLVARARGRYGFSRDSRDTTLQTARRAIQQVAAASSSGLRLPSHYVERAFRLYSLALQRNFLYGRRQIHVVATVLYIICRQEKSPHLLIDFSDALQVNVYRLGHCFLQFIRLLNLKLPIIDPSLYIHRYAAQLDLGDKLNAVILTALRTVTRLKKDWITTGRRPDSICAAALLISTRAHGFQTHQNDLANLFRVSSETLKARLIEFRATPSAHQTIAQFNGQEASSVSPDLEHDPPCFIQNLKALDAEQLESEVNINTVNNEDANNRKRIKISNREVLYDNIYSNIVTSINPDLNKDDEIITGNSAVDKLLREASSLESEGVMVGGWGQIKARTSNSRSQLPNKEIKMVMDRKRKDNVGLDVLADNQNSETKLFDQNLLEENDKIQETSKILIDNIPDNIIDNFISENDLHCFILSEEEQKKKSAIWERLYRPYMEEREKKRQVRDKEMMNASEGTKVRKAYTRKANNKPNSNEPKGATDKQSNKPVSEELKKTSKKINYEALNSLLD